MPVAAAPPEVCVGKNGGFVLLLAPPSVGETVPDGDKEADADETPDEEVAMVVEEEEGRSGGIIRGSGALMQCSPSTSCRRRPTSPGQPSEEPINPRPSSLMPPPSAHLHVLRGFSYRLCYDLDGARDTVGSYLVDVYTAHPGAQLRPGSFASLSEERAPRFTHPLIPPRRHPGDLQLERRP